MKKKKQVNDLGKDPILKLVLRLAIPSMIAQFVNVLYGIVDRIYIGNIAEVGDIALAGVGVCGPITTFISSFACLVGIGGAPLVAIRMGEGNKKGARQILANCFIMLVGMGVILSSIFLLSKNTLLMWFGASENSFPYANGYLTIYILGSIFAILASGLNQFIICQGFSTAGMATVVIGAVINLILDPIFIFGFRLGVEGAAIATVISQICSAFFVLKFLFDRRTPIRITFGGYSKRIMKKVLCFGFSPFIIIATDSILVIVLNAVLQRYGGALSGDMLITCATIVQSYMQLITMPMAGITGGTQPILSYNYGAKNTARIRLGEKWILVFAIVFASSMFLISQTLPHLFVQVFTSEKQLTQLSIWAIRTFTLGVIPLAFQYSFVDGFTALGIAPIAISLSLFRKTLFFVLTIGLPISLGATGVFYAEPVADCIGAIVSTIVFCFIFGRLLSKRETMSSNQTLYS